jgi:hypothetical protein|tara:strand:- start:23461 stop:24186 length:726 start_codon:yes stop_codon:yes gene_type:complete
MGYLDNTTVTVDAILTNKGRELLAAGGRLNIVKFALSDDEVDYDLWNPAHTLGTNYYGKVIEDMPVLEALPDETQMMRYKLITLPKDVIGIPVISVQPTAVTFTSLTQEITVSPSTLNLQGGNSTLGYTAILSDDTVATLEIASDGAVSRATTSNQDLVTGATSFLDDEVTDVSTAGSTITRTGSKFVLKAKPQANLTSTKKALLTIVGNETGGFKTIVVTVDPSQFNTLDIATSTPSLSI